MSSRSTGAMRFWRKGPRAGATTLKAQTIDGYRFPSGSEVKTYQFLKATDAPYKVTNTTLKENGLEYRMPVKRYHPDFTLGTPPRHFYVEVKGYFWPEDRTRLLLVRQSNPEADIRLLFDNPNARLSKSSQTTYAKWCEKHGFKWAKGPEVPEEWLMDAKS